MNERKFWDGAAKSINVRDDFIVDSSLKDEDFIRLLKPLLEGYTLEIGCGIGRLSELYDCGIDISPEMLKLAPKDKEHKVTDGRSIPYPDETFDSVFCVQVFQHLPSEGVKAYINESYRVLKKSGALVFQYVAGDSQDGPMSYKHEPTKLLKDYSEVFMKLGQLLPSWNWIIAKK